MRVLIYEPQFLGHNLLHAARLLRGLAELPCEPILATSSQAADSEEYRLHLGPLVDRFTLHPLDGFKTDPSGRRILTNGLRGALVTYDRLRQAIQQTAADHVLIPYANSLARIGNLPGGLKRTIKKNNAEVEILLHQGRYLYPKASLASRLRSWASLKLIAAGPWDRVYHLDDAAYETIRQADRRLAKTAGLLPDPIGKLPMMSQAAARRELGIPEQGRYVAVIGLVERRKGIDKLLAGLRKPELGSTDRLLLAGPIHPDVHTLISEQYADLLSAGRVVMVDRRLTEPEMGIAATAADVVATVYPYHPYTSGVLVVAAAVGRPLLGANTGWIGRSIKRFDLGWTCSPTDQEAIADAVVQSLNAISDYHQPPTAGRFLEFLSDANYNALWTARIRKRLGMQASPDERSWEWACGLDSVQHRSDQPPTAAA